MHYAHTTSKFSNVKGRNIIGKKRKIESFIGSERKWEPIFNLASGDRQGWLTNQISSKCINYEIYLHNLYRRALPKEKTSSLLCVICLQFDNQMARVQILISII